MEAQLHSSCDWSQLCSSFVSAGQEDVVMSEGHTKLFYGGTSKEF